MNTPWARLPFLPTTIAPMAALFLGLVALDSKAVQHPLYGLAVRTLPRCPTAPAPPTIMEFDPIVLVEASSPDAITVNGDQVLARQLIPFLQNVYRSRPEKTIFLLPSRDMRYASVLAILDDLQKLQLNQIFMMTVKSERERRQSESCLRHVPYAMIYIQPPRKL